MPLRMLPAAVLSMLIVAPAAAGDDARRLGDAFRVANPALALGLTFVEHDVDGRKALLLSLGTTLVATELAKHAFNDGAWGERPNGDDYSFPSGHASTTCAAAAFVQHRYDWRWALPLYATSAYTAYSRVDADKHHWRDVIAGCALAWGVSAYLVPARAQDRLRVAPLFDGDGAIGLSLRLDF